MPCLLVAIALLAPRVCMFLIWLLTNWFTRSFDTWYLPVIGIIFLPYTTLAYMAAILNHGSLDGGWIILLIMGVLADSGFSFFARGKGRH